MKKPPGVPAVCSGDLAFLSGRLDLSTAGWAREPEVAKKENGLLAHGDHSSTGISSGRPADREAVDAQRRLADTHGHALAFLAAGAHAAVQGHVVADHGDASQRIGAV